MKILVVNWRCPKNPEMGGAEVHMHEIFKRVAAKGHSVTYVAHNFKGAKQKEILDGIEIRRTGNKFLFNRQFKNYYKKYLAQEKFDLIVDDISKIPLGIPSYVSKPVVGIIHHIHGKSLYRELPKLLANYIIRSEKMIPKLYRNTPIFAVSESTKSELIELGQPENKIDILYNAIDHDLFDKLKVDKYSEPTICYIGRIKKYKNLEAIIDALPLVIQKIPNLKFKIGGSGDHVPNLKEYVNQKGLQNNIEFLGYLTEEQKAEEMAKSWLFVTMALKEGWGITVIEANAAGTPVIGSDVPGLRDSIRDNITGKLVDLNNQDKLSASLIELLTNKEKLNSMSCEAKNWASNFTWDKSTQHFLDKVYQWYPKLKE
ncbi:MAG: glycosyltransferase family 4 protein [Melioribacteraceae bacterium]|nr:MAG: glycosyltransferase family 4 protein [Melioribacteraceae bacterium]